MRLPARLARVERWSRRWGPLTIIFGRHVFGMRPAVTVASGMLRVPYPLFALSTAISTAPWAALWLWVGVRYGPRVGHFLNLHGWVYPAVPLLVIGVMVAATLHGRHTMQDGHEPRGPGGTRIARLRVDFRWTTNLSS